MSRAGQVILFVLVIASPLCAEDLNFPHEERAPAWQLVAHPQQVRISQQFRQKSEIHDGLAAEQILLESALMGAATQLVFPIPHAQAIQDLKASVAFRSTRTAGTLCFRVQLPSQIDPESGKALSFLVPGTTSTDVNEWQSLNCQLDKRSADRALQLVRARLQIPQLNLEGLYIDAVVLEAELPTGLTTIWIDDLQIQGFIATKTKVPGVTQMGQRQEDEFPVRMELDRLYINGQPRFPLILPHHGEPLNLLKQLGVNTVWIPDAGNQRLANELSESGFWTMAVPPRPTNERGEPLNSRKVSLAPFNEGSRSILFWYLGTRIPGSSASELVSWQTQVSDADRHYQRPILADVAGNEEYYSHYLDMLSSSRPLPFTGMSYRAYREWLIAKQRLSPGSFFWTWIDMNDGFGEAVGMEPEQLRLQVYAALSAGCRGLGFYTREALDREDGSNTEIRLMLAELNREIQMLEPILATGAFLGTIPVELDERSGRRRKTQSVSSQQRLTPEPRIREKSMLDGQAPPHHIEAAMIRSDVGMILLPVWYDSQAGYVPDQMAANKITLVVPGVSEAALAVQITPTGIKNLDRRRDTGGMRIELDGFSTTAAILVTSNVDLIKQLQAQTRDIGRSSSLDNLLLARQKLTRVKAVDQQLTDLGHPQETARDILNQAELMIQQGEQAIERQQFNSAREMAIIAMQLLRILQRQHWEAAKQTLPHPATSPYAIHFQSLPEHWELVERIGRRADYQVRSQLSSGNFEDAQEMVRDGWQHPPSHMEGVQTAAELYPASPPDSTGQYSLRLVCVPDDAESPPHLVSESAVRVATPPMSVKPGDIVYVTGWARVRFPAADRLDHALIFDSQQGTHGQIRFDYNQDWQRFELLREINSSDPFQVYFTLAGLGEMQIDDVSVVTLQPRTPVNNAPEVPRLPEPSLRDRARDLFNRIPGVDRIPSIPGFEQEAVEEP